jgi:hypothetical protein
MTLPRRPRDSSGTQDDEQQRQHHRERQGPSKWEAAKASIATDPLAGPTRVALLDTIPKRTA